MQKNRSRGFTLIELLVVIAIIGILSAVVLASLNTARQKGSDAAIQSDLSAIQTQAEIVYGSSGNAYGTVYVSTGSCTATLNTLFGDPVIAKAITGITSAGSSGIMCNSSAQTYAVSAALVAQSGKYWCIDNTGSAKIETSQIAAGTLVCP